MHTYSAPCVQNNFFLNSDSAPQVVAINFLTIFCNRFPLWPGCSCEQVYGGGHEFIPDLNLDLTNRVFLFRLCFRLCSQVVGVLGLRVPMSIAMRASWSGFNSTFFLKGKGGLTVSRCGTKAEGHFTVNWTVRDDHNSYWRSSHGIFATRMNIVYGIG